MEIINATDGYKLGHHRMYPEGTQMVYSNWTPRSNRYFPEAIEGSVVFGIQYFVKKYLIEEFNKWFALPKEEAIKQFAYRVGNFVDLNQVGTKHIEELYDLGYLPIEIKALPEGSICPIRVPMMTIKNTLPDFFWFTNYLETLISCTLWLPCTSATSARLYKKRLMEHARKTGFPEEVNLDFSCHDFSMRGMAGLDAAIISGMAHMTSFCGSETIPAIEAVEHYYNANVTEELVAATVPACYSEDTEVLTNTGWKYFKDLSDNDLVAQYNEDKSVEFVKPLKYFRDYYKGKLIHFKQDCDASKIDLLVTPNHKMVRRSQKTDKLQLFEASAALTSSSYTRSLLLVTSGYTKNKNSYGLSSLDKLKIAFQADGSYPSHKEDYTGEKSGAYPIRFSLKKDRKMLRLEELFEDAGIKYTKTKYSNGYYNIWANVPEHFDKNFDWVNVSELTYQECLDFLEELQYWDGCKKHQSIIYSSINKSCVDKVQAIANICGYKATINSYQDSREDCDRKLIWSICISKGERYGIAMHLKVEEQDYDGYVYCVSVPSKMIIVRRNNKSLVCGNTEHSVMCAGSEDGEIETYRRLINDLYPTGIISIVSDTWDFWQVVEKFLPKLKADIMKRDGRVVIRPDSGDPVDIICGLRTNPHYHTAMKEGKYYCDFNPFMDDDESHYVEVSEGQYYGAYYMLGKIFGWNTTVNDYRYPSTKVGLLYGDSITLERQRDIYARLENAHMAACNLVLGIGSYTYQFKSRDSLGFAVKATACTINGKLIEIYKHPKTDDGTKNSLKGLIRVEKEDGKYVAYDQQTKDAELQGCLKTVFVDGELVREYSLSEIRERVNSTLV